MPIYTFLRWLRGLKKAEVTVEQLPIGLTANTRRTQRRSQLSSCIRMLLILLFHFVETFPSLIFDALGKQLANSREFSS